LARKFAKPKKNILKSVSELKKNQILCYGIDPNPSKDRCMLEGDIFLDEFIELTLFY
jgi:hypothetical protein